MKPSRTKRLQHALLALLIVASSLSGSLLLPQRAHAQLVVHDPFNGIFNSLTSVSTAAEKVQGYVLNPLAWAVSKSVLQSIVNSTIKWVNSGFNGSPAFVTNLNKTLQNVGDTTANSFIKQLQTNGSIKSPFQTQVASAVSTNYLQSTASNGFFSKNPFTLGKASSNPTAFLTGGTSGFSQGGWDAWLSTSMNSANNPYGATLLANSAITSQVAGAQSQQSQEYLAGSGFASWRGNCQTSTTGQSTSGSASSASTCLDNSTPDAKTGLCSDGSYPIGTSVTNLTGSSNTTSLSGNSTCQSQNIITPGNAIAGLTSKSLGSGIDTLVNTHNFQEVLSSFLTQMVNQVLSSSGLFGTSQSSSSSSSSSASSTSSSTASSTSTTSALLTSFSQTLSQQSSQLQTFANEWGTIEAAAQSAKAAVLASTCYPNAQTTVSAVIQPIITEATTEITNAQTSITELAKIQAEIPSTSTTTDTTTQVAQASSDYSTFLSSSTLPSDTDISYAATQSTDSGTSTPQTLLTEMNQITQAAKTCVVTQ
ncbi:MAG: hypothetical protein P4M11_06410 [Candidatus Pacebacteria bacterium]|nr:hypothetical protein [Candidatus Paceibacterota bacterium]